MRSGDCVRLPPMWPGSDSYLLLYKAPRGFLSILVFPLSTNKIDLSINEANGPLY